MQDELTKKVRDWWNSNPFTYFVGGAKMGANSSRSGDAAGGVASAAAPEGNGPGAGAGLNSGVNPGADWNFFRNIDRKVIKWMPWAQKGFPLLSSVIDYWSLGGKKVLDIAVGSGWSTEQFYRAGAQVIAIDIAPRAVELTKKRFAVSGLPEPEVLVADAQRMDFPDATFDFALAFGCLMHMPDTAGAIDQIYRVLKPGGKFAAMMYNKNSLHYWWYIILSKGILRGKFFTMTAQDLCNRYTDGVYSGGNMLTKFYTPSEAKKLFGKFKRVRVRVFDDFTCVNHFPYRFFPLGSFLPEKIKEKLVRIFGQTLWIDAEK